MFYPAVVQSIEVNIMDVELKSILTEAEAVTVYNRGKAATFPRGSAEYEAVQREIASLTKGSHEMPAFGVALDHLTRQTMQDGVAVEFVYGESRVHNGMDFEKLFVRLDRGYYGVNLERFTDGKYQGRCFYLNLERPADGLYELATSLVP